MRQLILHIGSHKTGTTAIQTWAHANKDRLAAQGWRDLSTEAQANAHAFVGFDERDAVFPAGYSLREPLHFADCLRKIDAERVLVSSENFAFFFDDDAIEKLAKTVKPLFDDIIILCYLRRQDRHAVSHHMEGARADRPPEWQLWGHGLGALPQRNPFQPLYLNYYQRLGKWSKHFGRKALRVRVFDRRYLVDGDVVADFAATLGIDATGFVAPPNANTSLDRVKSRMVTWRMSLAVRNT